MIRGWDVGKRGVRAGERDVFSGKKEGGWPGLISFNSLSHPARTKLATPARRLVFFKCARFCLRQWHRGKFYVLNVSGSNRAPSIGPSYESIPV